MLCGSGRRWLWAADGGAARNGECSGLAVGDVACIMRIMCCVHSGHGSWIMTRAQRSRRPCFGRLFRRSTRWPSASSEPLFKRPLADIRSASFVRLKPRHPVTLAGLAGTGVRLVV